MFQFLTSLAILFLLNHQCDSMQIWFNITKTIAPTFDIICQYKQEYSYEVFNSMVIKMRNETFYESTSANPYKPTITWIRGVTWVTSKAFGQVTLNNYLGDDLGLFECGVNYSYTNGKNTDNYYSSIQFSIKQKVDPCKMEWINNVTISTMPTNAYIGGVSKAGGSEMLYVCRSSDGKTAGYASKVDNFCVVPIGNTINKLSTFDVLTGTGFDWKFRTPSWAPPKNAVVVGTDVSGNSSVYVGRCNDNSWGYMGRISGNFYFNRNGEVASNCTEHNILVCNV